jgi:hypothetical protein
MRKRVVTVVAAVSIGMGGYLHLMIWQRGYRYAPPRELFLLNVAMSTAVALALLVHSGKLTALAGLLVSAGSLGAFVLSRGPGLPTLHGRFIEAGLSPTADRFVGLPSALVLLLLEGLAVACCIILVLARGRKLAASPGWPTPPCGPFAK